MLAKFRDHLVAKNVASDIADKLCESITTSLVGTNQSNFKSRCIDFSALHTPTNHDCTLNVYCCLSLTSPFLQQALPPPRRTHCKRRWFEFSLRSGKSIFCATYRRSRPRAYVYMHTCTRTSTCMHTHEHMSTCTRTSTCTHAYAHNHAHTHIYTYIHTHTFHACILSLANTAHTRTRTHSRTYMLNRGLLIFHFICYTRTRGRTR